MERGGWLANRLADLIWVTHVVVTFWVAFGWLGPEWMLWGVVALVLIIEVQWLSRSDWCVLGDLEIWLRGDSRPEKPQEMGFVKRLFKIFLRIEMTPELGFKITRVWIKFSLVAALVNLFLI